MLGVLNFYLSDPFYFYQFTHRLPMVLSLPLHITHRLPMDLSLSLHFTYRLPNVLSLHWIFFMRFLICFLGYLDTKALF